jgi:diguanylate cyclase (GGDEF)-like protein/PAS domain S-box-containing protein
LNFFSIADGNAALVWLPTGLAVAAIVRFGPRILPGIYLSGVAASLYIGNNFELSLLFAMAYMMEPLVTLLILKKVNFSLKLYHFKDYLLLVVAGIGGSVVSAVIGSAALLLHNTTVINDFITVAIHWWFGNIIGLILLGPLLLLLSQTSFRSLLQNRSLEFGLLLLLASYIAITQFAGISLFGEKSNFSYAYYAVAVIIWAIIRFGHQTIALVQMILFSMGVWGLINQQGYFFTGIGIVEQNVDILFQYIFIVSLGSMGLAYTLKHQRLLSQALTKSINETYIFHQDDLQFEFINLSARSHLGLNEKNWQALTILDVQPDVSRQYVANVISNLKNSDNTYDVYQSQHQRVDGSTYPVEVRIEKAEQSGRHSYLATAVDITERIETQLYKDLGDSVCQHSTQGVVICNEKNEILRVNAAFSHITGYSEQEVIGKKPNMLGSGKHGTSFYEEMWATLEQKASWCSELYNRHQSGHLYLVDMTIKKFIHELGNKVHYMAMFTDITDEREQSLKLKHHAEHDLLTALPNRARLQQEFTYALAMVERQQKKLALLFLDLNGFKPINDTHGHQLGDQVLQKIALRLKTTVRESDIVSRVGGDEFVILMTNLDDTDNYQLVVNKIKAIIAKPMFFDEITVLLSVSVGNAIYPLDGADLDSLIMVADEAMYRDKQSK